MKECLLKLNKTFIEDTNNYRITNIILFITIITAQIFLKKIFPIADILIDVLTIVIYFLIVLRYKYFDYYLLIYIFIITFLLSVLFTNEVFSFLSTFNIPERKLISLRREFFHIQMIIFLIIYVWSFKNKGKLNLIK